MLNGVINIYKEKGFTSHDVVAKLRGILKQKKIGHTGTLDPDATGVLPVCLGKATKLCDMLTDKDKVYRTVMLLGVRTDTQDISGQVLEDNRDVLSEKDLAETKISEIINSFVGEYAQVPPMYSALKVNGKKLYELAREGKEIERKPRNVFIKSINIEKIEFPRVTMTVECSKGTYIRTLCDDIGRKAGCGACMEELERIRVSRFVIEDAMTLSEIEENRENITEYMIPVDKMFEQYPKVTVKSEFNKLLYNGNKLTWNMIENERVNNDRIRVYDSEGKFAGIYQMQGKELKPEKMFLDNN